MPPDDRPKSLPPILPTPREQLEAQNQVARAVGNLALGLSAHSRKITEQYEANRGLMLTILSTLREGSGATDGEHSGGPKGKTKPRPKSGATEVEPGSERGDEVSDVFPIPFTGGQDFAQLSRKTQRKIVRWLLLALAFVATHFAHFVYDHLSFEQKVQQEQESVHWVQTAKPMLPAPQLHLDAGTPPHELTK